MIGISGAVKVKLPLPDTYYNYANVASRWIRSVQTKAPTDRLLNRRQGVSPRKAFSLIPVRSPSSSLVIFEQRRHARLPAKKSKILTASSRSFAGAGQASCSPIMRGVEPILSRDLPLFVFFCAFHFWLPPRFCASHFGCLLCATLLFSFGALSLFPADDHFPYLRGRNSPGAIIHDE